MGRLIRRVMHRLIRGLVRARVAVVALLGLLLVAGGFSVVQAGLPALDLSVPGPRKAPESTESFLKAQQTGNVELMLNALSEEALDRLRARGMTPQELQRQMEAASERGPRFEQINYVGGQGLPDGTSLQFYVVAARGPSRPDAEYVTYIFTLDRSGKITKVQ